MKQSELNECIISIPKASPTGTSYAIVDIKVEKGKTVKKGDILFSIATDKATMEIEAELDGIIGEIYIEKDKEYGINDPAIFISPEGTKDPRIKLVRDHIAQLSKQKEEHPTEAIDKVSTSGEVNQEKQVAVETVNKMIFVPTEPIEGDHSLHRQKSGISASPKAKKLAKDLGVNLSCIKGSGPHGRILAQDVEQAPKSEFIFPKEFSQDKPGSYSYVKMSAMRSAIGNKLQASKQQIPHFYLSIDVEMDKLVEFRRSLSSTYGIKASINDFIVRASAMTLRNHMSINQGFDNQKEQIIAWNTVDIAIAVATDDGLITPIIRQADQKQIVDIASEVKSLVIKARKGKLKSHEYMGGSFTISNLGMMGVKDFGAIVNPPQAAILAVGCLQEYVKLEDGVCTNRHRTTFTLSCDHRIIDGADGAKFLQTFKKIIENPAGLLIVC